MHVPRAKGSRSTIVVDNEQVVVQALTLGRVLLAFMVAACRATVAVFLATSGAHSLVVMDNKCARFAPECKCPWFCARY